MGVLGPMSAWRLVVQVQLVTLALIPFSQGFSKRDVVTSLSTPKPLLHTETLTIGMSQNITSQGFPHRCCLHQKITLKCRSQGGARCYIHISFNDLDLPKRTDFKIYHSEDELPRNLFHSQPEFRQGMWQRPFISSTPPNNTVHLVLIPPAGIYDPADYVGFKFNYRVSTGSKPHYDSISADCPSIATSLEGDIIRLKSMKNPFYKGKWLDCVWHIKPPGSLKHWLNDSTSRVYVRLTEANLTGHAGGHFAVTGSPSSEGHVIASGRTLERLQALKEGYVSRTGLYVRAFMPAYSKENCFGFVFGILHLTNGSCPRNYSQCVSPFQSWCIPIQDVCNGAQNCPSGEDETKCVIFAPTAKVLTPATQAPMPSETAKVQAEPNKQEKPAQNPREKCSGFASYCTTPKPNSKICMAEVHSSYCRSNSCPGYHKVCQNGDCIYASQYCAEDRCPRLMSNRCGVKCLSDAHLCDGEYDCTDRSDESSCDSFKHSAKTRFYYLFIVPAIVIISVITFYKLCCQQKASSRQGRSTVVRTGSLRVPASSSRRPSPSPSRQNYSPVPPPRLELSRVNSGQSGTREGGTGEDSAPPPTYEEVTCTNIYLKPIRTEPDEEEEEEEEDMPPPYEKAIKGKQVTTNTV